MSALRLVGNAPDPDSPLMYDPRWWESLRRLAREGLAITIGDEVELLPGVECAAMDRLAELYNAEVPR